MGLLQGVAVTFNLYRSASLVEELRAELQAERIKLAQMRDEMLTPEELIVKLDVWEQCGR